MLLICMSCWKGVVLFQQHLTLSTVYESSLPLPILTKSHFSAVTFFIDSTSDFAIWMRFSTIRNISDLCSSNWVKRMFLLASVSHLLTKDQLVCAKNWYSSYAAVLQVSIIANIWDKSGIEGTSARLVLYKISHISSINLSCFTFFGIVSFFKFRASNSLRVPGLNWKPSY